MCVVLSADDSAADGQCMLALADLVERAQIIISWLVLNKNHSH